MQIFEEIFGTWNNQEIPIITLTNNNDVSIKAIPYGAHIVEWSVPDKDGNFDNITLGLENLSDYTANRCMYGATVGRVAGRIKDAAFTLDDMHYDVDKNWNGHQLHGGAISIDAKVWDYRTEKNDDEASVTFTYTDPDGMNGYPGNLHIEVTYTLTEADEWKITYRASTDKPTLFNPTNHVYFNLHGNVEKTILDHDLYVDADRYVELSETVLPTGEVLAVDGTPFDFRKTASLQQITDDHPQTNMVNGLDHPFVLNEATDEPSIILSEKTSGRTIKMWTDQPTTVIYTHNGPQENLGVPVHAGITLETQGYPDAINHEHFGNIILRPGEEYHSETIYQFSLK